jgi:hypothetical protein
MGKTIYRRTAVTDAAGEQHIYEPGDDVPDDIADRIDNPAVWEKPQDDDTPLGSSDTPTSTGPAFADAPYADSSEPLEPWLPDTGPVTEAGGNILTGEQAPIEPMGSTDGGSGVAPGAPGTKPSQEDLDAMTREQLDETARRLGLDPSGASNKAEVRSLIDSAEEPGS